MCGKWSRIRSRSSWRPRDPRWGREEQAQRVDHEVPPAPGGQLAAVEAVRPPFTVVLTVWLSMMPAPALELGQSA